MLLTEENFIFEGGICRMEAWKPGILGFLRSRSPSWQYTKTWAREMGACVHSQEVHNLVVTVGKQMVGDWAIDAEAIGLTYFAFGTNATVPVIGDSTLGTEVKRALFTSRVRSAQTIILDSFLTAANCTYFIKECGVFGGVSATATPGSGKLFCHYLLSYDNTAGLNDLTFEYQLTIG
jgi:hypothetical protein